MNLNLSQGSTEKRLECPFTWQMDEKLASEYEDNESFVNVDDQPIKALVHFSTLVYVHVVKKDLMTAYAKLKQLLDVLKTLDLPQLENDGISTKVLIHIIKATKYHYYKRRGNLAEVEKAMSEMPVLDLEELRVKNNSGTLNGCKSLAWSFFFDAPKSIAIAFASNAVTYSPNCAFWHFILGKKLRHMRRDDNNDEPLPDESEHLLKAYELTGTPYFGVYVAQMYQENKNYKKARQISMEIYNMNPQSVGIRLRLALLFIKSKNYDCANECLEFVHTRCPDNPMYLHYKGIFFEEQNNYLMAGLYYHKSAEAKNHKADIAYGKCMMKVNKNFNFIQHLDSMLPRHHKSIALTQQIFLHIAMQFLFRREDLKHALLYFLKAIQINPKSKELKSYKNVTDDYKTYNIIELVYNKLLPEIHQKYPASIPYDLSDVIEALEKLFNLCTNDGNTLITHVENMEL